MVHNPARDTLRLQLFLSLSLSNWSMSESGDKPLCMSISATLHETCQKELSEQTSDQSDQSLAHSYQVQLHGREDMHSVLILNLKYIY